MRPLLVCALALSRSVLLAQPQVEIVSVDPSGAPGGASSGGTALSQDGRFGVFVSDANDLVAGDTNGVGDVFVRDRVLAFTQRISVHTNGTQANGASFVPLQCVSADGSKVVFLSHATNLIANDTNGALDAFVRDLSTGNTRRVSVGTPNLQGNGSCFGAGISADGRFVVFASGANNLVAGDTNGYQDVFVRDLAAQQTELVSADSLGALADAPSLGTSISGDGRWVAFTSAASNLVAGDNNGQWDAFLRDRLTGTTTRVSLGLVGFEANDDTFVSLISADASSVVLWSLATNLVPGDTNGRADVFVHELASSTTALVSVATSGAQANDEALPKAVSADGSRIVFWSRASNLVPADTNAVGDVFVRHRFSGTTERVSADANGVEGNGESYDGGISGDGRFIGFSSDASNLVSGDSNGALDAFVREIAAPCSSATYCTSGVSSHACTPTMSTIGSASVGQAAGFSLVCSALEGQRSGAIFYGMSGAQSLAWASGSSSFLCVRPPTQRTTLQNSGGSLAACDGSLTLDFLQFAAANPAALGCPLTSGRTFWAQTWYRDPPAPKSTNLSDAVSFVTCP